MSVWDSNLLEDALDIIGTQAFSYYPYSSRTKNAIGVYVTTRGSAQALEGSIQPVPRQMFERLGLDLQKNYVTVFVSANVIDISRDVAGDQFVYGGKTYQAESRTDWFAQDGWDAIICVEVPATTPAYPPVTP